MNRIKGEIFNFVWGSKPDKIKRSVLMQDFKNGGLRLENVDYFIQALKAWRIRRIFDKTIKGYEKDFIWRNLTILEENCYLNITFMFTIVIRLLKIICSCEIF